MTHDPQLHVGATFSDQAHERSGTISTARGPIVWGLDPAGVLTASGDGQQYADKPLASTGGVVSHEVSISRSGSKPYLTVTSTVDDANRRVSLAMANDQSHLLLSITAIDLAVSTGTATVTGSYAGSAVNWSGTVDLNSTPWSGQPVPGWPPKAFASELQSVAFFAPLADLTSHGKPIPVTAGPVGPGHVKPMGFLRSVGKGLLWAGAAVLTVAVSATPAGPLVVAVVAGVSAFDASAWGDIIDEESQDPPVPDPIPPIDVPTSEEDTTGHVTGVSQDDSSTEEDGSGGGFKIDDSGADTHHEET